MKVNDMKCMMFAAVVAFSVNCASIVIAAPPPHVTGVSPAPVASATAQTLTVTGSSFVVGVKPSAGTALNVTSSKFTWSVVLSTAGPFKLTVRNPDGKTSAVFTVTVLTGPQPPPPPSPLTVTCPVNISATTSINGPTAESYQLAVTGGGIAPIVTNYSIPSGSLFPVTTSTVNVTAVSSDGQRAACSFTVSVTYTVTPPPPPGGSLINPQNLTIVGAFHFSDSLGANTTCMDGTYSRGLSFYGGPIAFNAAHHSLYMSNWCNELGEVEIPTPALAATIAALPLATQLLQPFVPITTQWGGGSDATPIPSGIGGLLVLPDGRIHGAGWKYYDANDTVRASQFVQTQPTNTTGFTGWFAIGDPTQQGFVGMGLASVPATWQTALGGNYLAFMCCSPIITRTSWGPNARVFDAMASNVTSATPLVEYTGANPTLGTWGGNNIPNPVFNMATAIGGLVVPTGWNSALYFGVTGTGTPCYGEGTSDPLLAGTPEPDDPSANYCYDPVSSDKGNHAYPYANYVWAYDLAELAKVKAGLQNPWDVKPYATWAITLPYGAMGNKALQPTLDPATNTIYLLQPQVDPGGGYFAGPVIYAIKVQ
jgi:hypothetical protein